MKTKENQTDIVEGEVIKGNLHSLPAKERAEGAAKEVQEVFEKWNCQLIIEPRFKARDDGTYSVVLQQGWGDLPKQG